MGEPATMMRPLIEGRRGGGPGGWRCDGEIDSRKEREPEAAPDAPPATGLVPLAADSGALLTLVAEAGLTGPAADEESEAEEAATEYVGISESADGRRRDRRGVWPVPAPSDGAIAAVAGATAEDSAGCAARVASGAVSSKGGVNTDEPFPLGDGSEDAGAASVVVSRATVAGALMLAANTGAAGGMIARAGILSLGVISACKSVLDSCLADFDLNWPGPDTVAAAAGVPVSLVSSSAEADVREESAVPSWVFILRSSAPT
jgi:hypothetical protein